MKEPMMTESDWIRFYHLLRKIVNMPLETWQQKASAVTAAAGAKEDLNDLSEFVSWFE